MWMGAIVREMENLGSPRDLALEASALQDWPKSYFKASPEISAYSRCQVTTESYLMQRNSGFSSHITGG